MSVCMLLLITACVGGTPTEKEEANIHTAVHKPTHVTNVPDQQVWWSQYAC